MSFRDRLRPLIPKPVLNAKRAVQNAGVSRRREAERRRREAIIGSIDPQRDIPELLHRHTCISKLSAATPYGQFAFYLGDSIIGWGLALEGEWEARETAVLVSLVREGDTVVDVGANLGWHSVQLARKAGPTGRVFAYEPEPANFLLLRENLETNGVAERVVARRLALLNEPGVVEFELSPFNYGDHRVRFAPSSGEVLEFHSERMRDVITVEAMRLDDALTEADILPVGRLRLLKMDCQGSEAAIALGAPETLRRVDYLATEFWPYGIVRSGHDPREYLGILDHAFESFATLSESTTDPVFRPTSELRSDAGLLSGDEFRFYLLKSANAES